MANSNSYPLSIDQGLLWKVRNFPDSAYNFDPGDNLTTIMSVLLGSAGVGQLNAMQMSARLTNSYLQFSDLESLLGSLIQIQRLVSEQYSTNKDPFTDQLTLAEWQDVYIKDSSYRERLSNTIIACLKGATLQGLQAIAEATTGFRFQAFENWTTASGTLASQGWSRGLGTQEVVLVPLVPSGFNFTNELYANVQQLTRAFKPANTIVTVVSSGNAVNPYSPVPYTIVSGSSELLYVDRNVIANGVSLPSYAAQSPDASVQSRYWIRNGVNQSAPYFAFTQTQEIMIDQTSNISTVNITPITINGPLSVSGTTTPLGNPSLEFNTVVWGA